MDSHLRQPLCGTRAASEPLKVLKVGAELRWVVPCILENLRCSSLTKLPELPEEEPDGRALEAEPADNGLETEKWNSKNYVDLYLLPQYANKVGTWPTISGPPYQTPTYNLRPRPTISDPNVPYQAPFISVRFDCFMYRIYLFYLIDVSIVVPSSTVIQ